MTAFANGQSMQILAGIQADALNFKVNKGASQTYENVEFSDSAAFANSGGVGWIAGISYMGAPEQVAFKWGLTFSWQEVRANYSSVVSDLAPGGGNSSTRNGTFVDRSAILELPIQVSIGSPKLRFDIGLAPWILLSADHKDSGTQTGFWYIYGHGSGDYSIPYSESNSSLKAYTRYGLSLTGSLIGQLTRRVSVSVSPSVSLLPIYNEQVPYKGHHTQFRFCVGHRLLHKLSETEKKEREQRKAVGH